MGKIADGKKALNVTVQEECDDCAKLLAALIARARENGQDSKSLGALGTGWNGFASTLEHAGTQLQEVEADARAVLDAPKPKIAERGVALVADAKTGVA